MNFISKILAWWYGFPLHLYITRHGESHRNHGLGMTKTGLFFDDKEQFSEWGSHADHNIPLTKKGILQASDAGVSLARAVMQEGIRPSVIIHSGYKRALHTACHMRDAVITQCGYDRIPLVEDFSIRERDSGITHVLLAPEVEALMTWNRRYWLCVGPIHARPWSGESLIEMREGRIRTFFRNEITRYAGKSVILVCHGRAMQVMHMELLKMSLEEMEAYIKEPHPKNCEIRHYRFDWRTRKMLFAGVIS